MSIFRYLSGHGANYGGYGGHGHYGSGKNHGGHGYNRHGTQVPPQACPHCQRANDHDARFCASCGGALIAQCSNCKQMLSPMAGFCSKCGKEVNAAQGSN